MSTKKANIQGQAMIRLEFVCAALWIGVASAQDPQQLNLNEFKLELTAHWESVTDTVYKFEQKYALVRDLKPTVERETYDASQFRPFLPDRPVAVGDSWQIDADDAVAFLKQFHTGVTTELHHDRGMGIGAPGGWACLRLIDDDHAEIVMRVHADILLEGDGQPNASSWFTPGQFRGRMVVDRRNGKVVFFDLGVPSQRANVDINIHAAGSVIADIGRIPRMELVGGDLPEYSSNATQIGALDADKILAGKFYPFHAIGWQDLAAARTQSVATGKPLHVVALFGSLDDESC
jgi:hypothetical protein